MFAVSIIASTGKLDATFTSADAVIAAAKMVASGAQVSQGWDFYVRSHTTGATMTACGQNIHGMTEVIANLMETIVLHMPARVLAQGEGMDVVVPVRLAMHDGTLIDAEDYVRKAMNNMLDSDPTDGVGDHGTAPAFSYNGDPVTHGSAKEDR